MAALDTPTVRYLKLGSARDQLTEKCLKDGEAFVHFGTSDENVFRSCEQGRWDVYKTRREHDELARAEVQDGPAASDSERARRERAAKQNATAAANQLNAFWSSDDKTIWITFHDGRLYWARFATDGPTHDSIRGSVRKVQGGWSDRDFSGEHVLTMATLWGRLTKTAGYRSTTCAVEDPVANYLLRRLRNEPHDYIDVAESKPRDLATAMLDVVNKLTWSDFELLAELLFSGAGWRRITLTGSTMKFHDLVLEQPLDRRRISVQVKSAFKADEYDEYAQAFQPQWQTNDGDFWRFYFIYHTDDRGLASAAKESPDVQLVGPRELVDLAVDAGLARWMIDRVR